MPVSLAMILWLVADSRISIEITITLTRERRIVPLITGLAGLKRQIVKLHYIRPESRPLAEDLGVQ
jgi:hypothetical protein